MAFHKRTITAAVLPLILFMGQVIRTTQAGIAVSPLKQEISLKPGEQADVYLSLSYNNRLPTDAPQQVSLSLTDVQVSQEGALEFPAPGTVADSAAKWIALATPEVNLDPGLS